MKIKEKNIVRVLLSDDDKANLEDDIQKIKINLKD